MGKIEDIMVYTKLVILIIISFVLINHSNTSLPVLFQDTQDVKILSILIVASLTFVAFEGFQLVINAVNEMDKPEKNIPYAIYISIFIAIFIYLALSIGAILAIPLDDIIKNQEYALASGASKVLGHWGTDLVIIGALLATSSAISGTLFGASRQISVIAHDGYFPSFLTKRKNNIPIYSIIMMSVLSFILIIIGDLKVILEFSSVTFLLVSFIMAYTNYKIYKLTKSSMLINILAMIGLFMGTALIIYYEAVTQVEQLYFIAGLYVLLSFGAWLFSRTKP